MNFTAQQIAEILGGTIEGNPNAEVKKCNEIEQVSQNIFSYLMSCMTQP